MTQNIPLSLIQSTAQTLMEKAAIEIPQDYLDGLKRAADTEDGDLSSFVLRAMLDNYEAAKEDRRAMCGDTGVPRWFVKLGNDARVEGGMVALEGALRRATAHATNSCRCAPTACTRCGAPITTITWALVRPKSNTGLNQRAIG
jgi:L(+)-tartrate dehydratase alpha subunit